MSIEFFISARECANTDDEIQDWSLAFAGLFLWREVNFVDIYCTDDVNLPTPFPCFSKQIFVSVFMGVPLFGDWTLLPF